MRSFYLLCILIAARSTQADDSNVFVCNYPNDGDYRTENPYKPEDIPPKHCSHIMFDSAKLKNKLLSVPQNEIGLFPRFRKLKSQSPTLKLWLSVSGDKDMAVIAADANARKAFVADALNRVKEWKFDGLVIDWQRRQFSNEEISNYIAMLGDAKKVFSGQKSLSAIFANQLPFQKRVKEISKYVDYIFLMTHEKPKQNRMDSIKPDSQWLADILGLWIKYGASPQKMLLGLSTYADLTFIDGSPRKRVTYSQVCDKIKRHKWHFKWSNKMNPMTFSSAESIVYDNIVSMSVKTDLVVKTKLAGAWLKDLSSDDLVGTCGHGKSPLVKEIAKQISPASSTLTKEGEYVLFCYYGRFYHTKPLMSQMPEYVPPHLCTHIVFQFAKIDKTNIVPGWPNDQSVDGDVKKGFYYKINSLKMKNKKLKTLLSISDHTDYKEFQDAMASDKRKTFANNALAYVKKWNFDGLSMDITPDFFEKIKFTLLLQDLHETFIDDDPKLLLTCMADTGILSPLSRYEESELSKYVHYIFIKTFDLSPRWPVDRRVHYEITTEQRSPLSSLNRSINYWLEQKVDSKKLVVGIAAYGKTYTLKNPNERSVGSKVINHGKPGYYSKTPGFLFYNEVCHLLMHHRFREVWDLESSMPYAFRRREWVTYDNERSVDFKVNLIKKYKLAGAVIWEITQDDFHGYCEKGRYPLTGSVYMSLFGKSYERFKFNPSYNSKKLFAATTHFSQKVTSKKVDFMKVTMSPKPAGASTVKFLPSNEVLSMFSRVVGLFISSILLPNCFVFKQ